MIRVFLLVVCASLAAANSIYFVQYFNLQGTSMACPAPLNITDSSIAANVFKLKVSTDASMVNDLIKDGLGSYRATQTTPGGPVTLQWHCVCPPPLFGTPPCANMTCTYTGVLPTAGACVATQAGNTTGSVLLQYFETSQCAMATAAAAMPSLAPNMYARIANPAEPQDRCGFDPADGTPWYEVNFVESTGPTTCVNSTRPSTAGGSETFDVSDNTYNWHQWVTPGCQAAPYLVLSSTLGACTHASNNIFYLFANSLPCAPFSAFPAPKPHDATGAIVGSVIGGILLAAIIISIMVVTVKRQSQGSYETVQ